MLSSMGVWLDGGLMAGQWLVIVIFDVTSYKHLYRRSIVK